MAEVKWSARRVSDGVLVDVTGDTEGTPETAPTANELEAGGVSSGLSVLGPYTVNYNTTDASGAHGVTLAALASGVHVLRVWPRITVDFTKTGGTYIIFESRLKRTGGSAAISSWDGSDGVFNSGGVASKEAYRWEPPTFAQTDQRVGIVTGAGVSLGFRIGTDGTLTAGACIVHALIWTPA